MVEQDGEILGSAPCLAFLILRGLGENLCVLAGLGIAGVMLDLNGSDAGIGLSVVAERIGVYEHNSGVRGYGVGTGGVAERCCAG